MTLYEYVDLLKKQWWFYDNSENDYLREAGHQMDIDLQIIADDEGPKFRELYEAYKASMFSGPDFNTPKIPLPRL